jgi:hypothetical protein
MFDDVGLSRAGLPAKRPHTPSSQVLAELLCQAPKGHFSCRIWYSISTVSDDGGHRGGMM